VSADRTGTPQPQPHAKQPRPCVCVGVTDMTSQVMKTVVQKTRNITMHTWAEARADLSCGMMKVSSESSCMATPTARCYTPTTSPTATTSCACHGLEKNTSSCRGIFPHTNTNTTHACDYKGQEAHNTNDCARLQREHGHEGGPRYASTWPQSAGQPEAKVHVGSTLSANCLAKHTPGFESRRQGTAF
jgi:hypothetical protein